LCELARKLLRMLFRSPRALAIGLVPSVISCIALDRDPVDHGPPCTTSTDPGGDRASCQFRAGDLPEKTIACPSTGTTIPIDHVIVLMQENRSFDHYLGHLVGHGQDDVDVANDTAFNLADDGSRVAWHHAGAACFDDTNHTWSANHRDWNQGKNDGFVLGSAGANDPIGWDPSGSRAMSFYDSSDLPFYYRLASTFAISDRYFADVLGPTFPNRMYLYAGSSFGLVSDDIDTDIHKTIFHVLSERGISWKVYQSDVAAAFSTLSFLADSLGHVSSIGDFTDDARGDRLPMVAFIDPAFLDPGATATDEHPPSDVQVGQAFVARQVSALMTSASWDRSAMFITYDEAGGLYDHVSPPAACLPGGTRPAQQANLGGFDRYGFRVPMLLVSPYAKAHMVSHVVHSHASILRFIEARWGIPALTGRDANADALLDMFDFANPPFLTPPDLGIPAVDSAKLSFCRGLYGK
jgi:phospholipase C